MFVCGCGRKPRAVVVEGKGHKVDTCNVQERTKTAGESEVKL